MKHPRPDLRQPDPRQPDPHQPDSHQPDPQRPDLDLVADAIRNEPLAAETVAAAADKVRARLASTASGHTANSAVAPIHSCSDFQSLIPDYLAGALAASRALLLEDHSRSCVPCRRALRDARSGSVVTTARGTTAARYSWSRRIAAAVAIGVGLGSIWMMTSLRDDRGPVAKIEQTTGTMYQVQGEQFAPMSVAADLEAGREIRTAKGSTAVVRLVDGSEIELAERTALSVSSRGDDTTIQLSRGNIIVEAAKRQRGHLYVATDDCLVAVTGTIFSVNHGTKGSRVSVIEGSVQVADSAGEQRLQAGEQVSTHPSLGQVSLGSEIAWSRRVDTYLRALSELANIGDDIRAAVVPPAPRDSSRLLARVPAGTVAYGAVPNVSRSLGDAYQIFRDRMQQSEVLRDWLAVDGAAEHQDIDHMDQAIGRLRELGAYLGDEVVFALQMDEQGEPSGILLLAETSDPTGLARALDDTISQLHVEEHVRDDGATGSPVLVVDDVHSLTADDLAGVGALVWLHDGLVVAGPAAMLSGMQASADADALSGTSFHQRIVAAYDNGVNWLFAVDAKAITTRSLMRDEGDDRERAAMQRSGLASVEHVIGTERTLDGSSDKRLLVTFDEARRGLASWLAAPAPMGSLEYVSPDAALAGAFVMKDPRAMLDDLFELFEGIDPSIQRSILEFEATYGLRIRDDLAAPLGGEIAFALDGPLLPTPSWKLVIEVYDAGALMSSVQWLVEQINVAANEADDPGLVLEHGDLNGVTVYTLRHATRPGAVRWAFSDGFLLAGPNEAVLSNALRNRDSGFNLARSSGFTSLFPEDGHANFSAVAYQNLASLLAAAAQRFGGTDQLPLSPEQTQALAQLAEGAEPTLFVGYADADRIEFVSKGRGGLFGMDLGTLIRLNGLLNMDQLLDRLHPGAGRGHAQP